MLRGGRRYRNVAHGFATRRLGRWATNNDDLARRRTAGQRGAGGGESEQRFVTWAHTMDIFEHCGATRRCKTPRWKVQTRERDACAMRGEAWRAARSQRLARKCAATPRATGEKEVGRRRMDGQHLGQTRCDFPARRGQIFNIVARHDSAARIFATRKAGKRRASDNKCGFAQRDHNVARAATPRDAASDGQERRGPTAHGRETLHCYRNLGNAISPCLGTRRGHLWTSRRGATKQAASSQAVSRSKTREARDAAWLAARSKCFARQRIATPQATVGRPRTAGQRGAAGGDSGQRFATWSLMQPYLDIAA